jgi:hypothetical protein
MSKAAWVPESDWATVKVGQTVRLVNPDGEVTFNVGFAKPSRIISVSLKSYYPDQWDLFVEAHEIPPIPTTPGFYVGHDALNDNPHFIVRVDTEGTIWFPKYWQTGGWSTLGSPERFAPFTRLEPVAA